ncbi:MAG: FecR family protein [Comamonadaceae bacterium]|nr:MAG: FecR family protein [Comamonadaceae bacterium]
MTAQPAGDQATAPPPLPQDVVAAAVDWLVHLWSGTATDASRAQWRNWRAQHPAHERAWQHIEATNARWRGASPEALNAPLAVATFARSQRSAHTRRRVLGGLGGLAAGGVVAWSSYRQLPWQAWSADVRTAKGEQRTLTLPDGTRLQINTGTAINVRYSASLRRLQLLEGELFITTSHDTAQPPRPFVVDTPAGRVQALGTRFTVRHDGGQNAHAKATEVAVYEGAVEVRNDSGPPVRIDTGEGMRFTLSDGAARRAVTAMPAATTEPAWTEGVLVATDLRLADFVQELRRYRSGTITVAPAVADLRLSGVFPLADTDRILQALAQVLPVEVRVPVRWWVRIGPLAG